MIKFKPNFIETDYVFQLPRESIPIPTPSFNLSDRMADLIKRILAPIIITCY